MLTDDDLRFLTQSELRLVEYLLSLCHMPYKHDLPIAETPIIDLTHDCGMGSVEFFRACNYRRKFGRALIEVDTFDVDGRRVMLQLCIDQHGYLYQLDSFTADFGPLIKPLGEVFVFENINVHEIDECQPKSKISVPKETKFSKMSDDTALKAQCFLHNLATEPLSLAYVFSGDDTWMLSVDLIYRIYQCGLAEFEFDVLVKNKKNLNVTYDDIDDFCYHLSITHPDDLRSDIWQDAKMILTPFGQNLINQYFQDFDRWYDTINTAFIEKLEDIFIEHGLAWNEKKPLFPTIGTYEIA